MLQKIIDDVHKNADIILSITKDKERILKAIKADGARIYMSGKITREDVEIMASRAIALLAIMDGKAD